MRGKEERASTQQIVVTGLQASSEDRRSWWRVCAGGEPQQHKNERQAEGLEVCLFEDEGRQCDVSDWVFSAGSLCVWGGALLGSPQHHPERARYPPFPYKRHQ